MNLNICYLKIDISCEASLNFHHMPWQCDSQKTRSTTRLKCCACHATWQWRSPKCSAGHENCNASSGKRRESIAPATHNNFRHVIKHVGMSQSATPAMRNEATRRLKHPKVTTVARLAIGTAIRPSRSPEQLRTVADGCERLRTVANVNATSNEHTLNPQTPRVKREPLLRIRENLRGRFGYFCGFIPCLRMQPKLPVGACLPEIQRHSAGFCNYLISIDQLSAEIRCRWHDVLLMHSLQDACAQRYEYTIGWRPHWLTNLKEQIYRT